MSTELIFVCGTQRSGVDLMLDFLSAPKAAGWLPDKLAEHPARLRHARRIRYQNWPVIGEFYLERRNHWKHVPAPGRADGFLKHYLPDFDLADRTFIPPGPEHVKDGEAEVLKRVIGDISYAQKKSTLVLGYTGFPRVRMLRSIFPDARFIHCIRDPRSIAFQLTRMVEEKERDIYERREEIIPLMPDVLQDRLKELKMEPLSFCGVYVRWLHEQYKEELGEIPKSHRMEVAYSDILSRPMHPCNRALEFAGFPVDKRFSYYLKYHYIQVSNKRMQRKLNDEETELLAEAIAPIA